MYSPSEQISIIGATSPLGIDLVGYLAKNGYDAVASYREPARANFADAPAIRKERLYLTAGTDFSGVLTETIVWLAHLDQGRFNDREVESNLTVFHKFLDQALISGTKKIVFVSSGGSVYGETDEPLIREDHALNPLSSYGKTKSAMEALLVEKARDSDVATAILRPGNIYGFTDPNRDKKGIVAAFLDSIVSAKPFTLIHGGRTVRDYVHVDDVVRGIAAAIESPRKEILWNVATGVGSSTAKVIEEIRQVAGVPMPEIHHVDNYSSDVETNILSIERILSESMWTPRVALEDGIKRTAEATLSKDLAV